MEQLWNYLFHLAQFFASFTKITGFFEALSTSPFAALNCSVNFWILLKFPIFFLICSFHKKHIFSSGLPYLPFYCVSVTQGIFQFFVIFAKFVCKTWTYLIRSFQCDPTAVNNIWDTPARKLAVWYSWCLVYPSKTKTQQVGNKLGKFTFFINIVFHLIHWPGSVYGVYLVKCSSNHYLRMPGLWVQQDPFV